MAAEKISHTGRESNGIPAEKLVLKAKKTKESTIVANKKTAILFIIRSIANMAKIN